MKRPAEEVAIVGLAIAAAVILAVLVVAGLYHCGALP